MGRIHKHLHLQHHKHTGKLLPHHHTSYRSLAVIFVLAGACMLGVNALGHTAADSLLGVTATVNEPAPSSSPTITAPEDNTKDTDGAVIVEGDCPFTSPQPFISISVDKKVVGSAICDDTNRFALPLSLVGGTQTIAATAVSVTGQAGPVSSTVHVKVPATVVNTDVPTITNSESYTYLGSDRVATWSGSVLGSSTSYTVRIDWGDGTQDSHTVAAGSQRFTHTYSSLQSHNIYLTAAAGVHFVSEQFAAVTPTSALAPGATSGTKQPFINSSTIVGLYSLYVTMVAVCGIIWLEAKHTAKQQVVPVAHSH